jgi:hypothetical protein
VKLLVCGHALAGLNEAGGKRIQSKNVKFFLCSVKQYTIKIYESPKYVQDLEVFLISSCSKIEWTAASRGHFLQRESLQYPLERRLDWLQTWSKH